jgi:hypothetical protein
VLDPIASGTSAVASTLISDCEHRGGGQRILGAFSGGRVHRRELRALHQFPTAPVEFIMEAMTQCLINRKVLFSVANRDHVIFLCVVYGWRRVHTADATNISAEN